MLRKCAASRAARAIVAGGRTCARGDEPEPRVSLATCHQNVVTGGRHWEGEEGGKSPKNDPRVLCPGCVARPLGVTLEVELASDELLSLQDDRKRVASQGGPVR